MTTSTERELTAAPAWDERTLRAPHEQPDKARRVEAMFDAIAPTYEKINRVATFGRDAAWRRAAIAATRPRAGDVAVDVCCGTGDMIRALARVQPGLGRLIGVDFSANMLACGDYAGAPCPIQLLRADGLRLPLQNSVVDVITCAFGIRNFQNLAGGLREMGRVARPGARLAILEFANPENRLLRWGYRLYCETLLPRLGALLAHDRSGAYRYLPKSIETFETRASLLTHLRAAGFIDVQARGMNFGGVVLYSGVRGGCS